MATKIRKTVVAAAVAVACGVAGGALAIPGTIFDVNGAGGPNTLGVDRFVIDEFDWGSGNTLITNTVPEGDAGISKILMQANLSSLRLGATSVFGYPTSIFSLAELTFQMKVEGLTAPAGTDAIEWTDAGTNSTASFFNIFYDPVGDSLDITGCGYGSVFSAPCAADGSILILSGTVEIVSMGWDPTTAALTILDANGVNTQSPILTQTATGSGQFKITVTSFDPAFFLGPVSTILMNHTGTNDDPFSGANPSNQVLGRNVDNGVPGVVNALRNGAYGTDNVNNGGAAACAGGGQADPLNPVHGDAAPDDLCDLHTKNDAASIITSELVPEPGSLALLGLGLGVLGAGAAVRRRKTLKS